ncbi:MAG: class I SAM-dependent methyltransferase [Anaerolineae bacterium]
MDITTVYTILAPIYDLFRPWWIAAMAREAEECLESEILPRYLTPHTRILDLGCGTGVNLERLLRLGLPFRTYVGLDLTPAMLARARLKGHALTEVKGNGYCDQVRLLRGDMRRVPFSDASFDFVLSTWAVEHVTPVKQVVCEGLRVLKPGGHLVLLCHCCPLGRWRWPLRLTEGLLLMHCPDPDDLKAEAQVMCRYFAAGLEALVLVRKPWRSYNTCK